MQHTYSKRNQYCPVNSTCFSQTKYRAKFEFMVFEITRVNCNFYFFFLSENMFVPIRSASALLMSTKTYVCVEYHRICICGEKSTTAYVFVEYNDIICWEIRKMINTFSLEKESILSGNIYFTVYKYYENIWSISYQNLFCCLCQLRMPEPDSGGIGGSVECASDWWSHHENMPI